MDHRLSFLSWLLVGIVLGGLVWVPGLKAQSRVLIQREEAEKTKQEGKPPGEVAPGPKGTTESGYGSVHKPIKGTEGWGQKPGKPQGHVSPSASQATSDDLPSSPKSVKLPKEPEVPKAIRKSSPEKPKPLGLSQDMIGAPDFSPGPGSWVQEEYQKLLPQGEEEIVAEEEGVPSKSPKTIREEDDEQE